MGEVTDESFERERGRMQGQTLLFIKSMMDAEYRPKLCGWTC